MMTAKKLIEKIKVGLPDAEVEAIDPMGDGQHWQVIVTSSQFEGKSRLERHKLVMTTVGDLIPDQIHAIEIKPFTPDEIGRK